LGSSEKRKINNQKD